MQTMAFGDAIAYVAQRQSGPPCLREAKAYELVAWLRQMARHGVPRSSGLAGGETLTARLGPGQAVVFTVTG